MGEIIEFPSNAGRASGYLAVPSGGAQSGPGVIVLQEWWGLVAQIKRTCDRFAEAGFLALAPDLYHGTTVPLTEPDEAGKQMMALRMDDAAKDLSGAVDDVRRRTGRDKVGVIGFCMGGGLAPRACHPTTRRRRRGRPRVWVDPVAGRAARLLEDGGRGPGTRGRPR